MSQQEGKLGRREEPQQELVPAGEQPAWELLCAGTLHITAVVGRDVHRTGHHQPHRIRLQPPGDLQWAAGGRAAVLNPTHTPGPQPGTLFLKLVSNLLLRIFLLIFSCPESEFNIN